MLESHGHRRSSSWGRTYSFSSAINRGFLTEEQNRDVKAGIQPTLQVGVHVQRCVFVPEIPTCLDQILITLVFAQPCCFLVHQCVQVFLTNSSNVFLLEPCQDVPKLLDNQVEVCKGVLSIYRHMIMEHTMNTQTWLVTFSHARSVQLFLHDFQM